MSSIPAAARRSPSVRAWVRLVRVHFVPMSLSSGLAGYFAAKDSPTFASVALGLAVCTTGYGIGVIINDYADRRADAINAPDRPLVTGEVNPTLALALVSAVSVAVLALGFALATPVAVWSLLALAGHFVYTATKPIPMVGNLVNGVDIALFTMVGAAAGAPDRAWYDMPADAWATTGLIAVAIAGFCLVGYFKDVPGDTAAGYRTLPVVLGPARARLLAPPFPVAAVGGAAAWGAADGGVGFWVLLALAAAGFALSMRELLSDPEGRAYEALTLYTRASVLLMLALGALQRPLLFLAIAVPMLAFLELTLRETRGTGQA
ncbi:MAG TPA: UbiA prenyltransferase family protein [Thermoleophilaceae bacterium]|nr:UbiA prenyltransferase family protein [Thermoleophilaceae bacterium]